MIYDDDESTAAWLLRNGLAALCIGIGERVAADIVIPWFKRKLQEMGVLAKQKRKALVVHAQMQHVETDDDDEDE